jgi:hypothetical protein
VGDLDSARAFALSLPGSTEEPHFDMSSFRVRGKIFATVPPDDEHLHVFVDEGEVHAAVAEDPAAFEPLLWGQRLRGLRIRIAAAPNHRVAELLEESWRRRAPARLAAEWDAERGGGSPRPDGAKAPRGQGWAGGRGDGTDPKEGPAWPGAGRGSRSRRRARG